MVLGRKETSNGHNERNRPPVLRRVRNRQGLGGLQPWCAPDASFSAQTGALAGVTTLEAYTDWIEGMFTPVPDGRYKMRSFAVDEDRNNVAAYGVFRGTNTGKGGPVPPTGKRVEADYVYVMRSKSGKIVT